VGKEKRVFANLKFFDIPVRVAAAVKQLSGMDATFCKVHGNQPIMEAEARASLRSWR
jgi:orotidine-5'-phosphate decarboxylase